VYFADQYLLHLSSEHMQQEIDTVIGPERVPNMEDRKSLPFTDAVIHEVQRLLDITPMSLPHYAVHDISFRGYDIPKVPSSTYTVQKLKCAAQPCVSDGATCQQGTMIIPMLHSALREEQHWDTPWSFNPQHFLDLNGNFKNNPAFIPFSAGTVNIHPRLTLQDSSVNRM